LDVVASLDLGLVLVGETRSKTIDIKNKTCGAIEMNFGDTTSIAPFAWTSLTPCGSLPRDGICRISIDFQPETIGRAQVSVGWSVTGHGDGTITFLGTGYDKVTLIVRPRGDPLPESIVFNGQTVSTTTGDDGQPMATIEIDRLYLGQLVVISLPPIDNQEYALLRWTRDSDCPQDCAGATTCDDEVMSPDLTFPLNDLANSPTIEVFGHFVESRRLEVQITSDDQAAPGIVRSDNGSVFCDVGSCVRFPPWCFPLSLRALPRNGPGVVGHLANWVGCLEKPDPLVCDAPVEVNLVEAHFKMPNRMFVSTMTVRGRMEFTPPASPTLVGWTAADAICAAEAATLSLAGSFIAWPMTQNGDALNELQASVGWVRLDGKPFARNLGDGAITPEILYPPWSGIDLQTSPPQDEPVWTGPVAGMPGSSCEGWESDNQYHTGVVGMATSGTEAWLHVGDRPCNGYGRIYCVEYGRNVHLSVPRPTGPVTLAFVSTGTLPIPGGPDEADTMCRDEGQQIKPDATFKAFLAKNEFSAMERLQAVWSDETEIIRPDGVVIGTMGEIRQGSLRAAWNVQSNGSHAGARERVWTGARSPSEAGTSQTTCSNWGSSAGSGTWGILTETSRAFFGAPATARCSEPGRVYCIQVPDQNSPWP
jgi:hypothetical protein